jgi:predicted nucleic acid-binding protein
MSDTFKKNEDRQMDLADACVVRLTELMPDSRVITLDRTDFEVYRRNGREVVPILAAEL